MSAPDALLVRLVAPGVWQPHVMAAFAGLSPVQLRTAQAVMRFMHDRHVGITPRLARELAILLLTHQPNPEKESGAWGAVFSALLRSDSDGAGAAAQQRSGERRFGLLLSARPGYTALRVALPVLLEACRSIGWCYLFSEDEAAHDVTAEEYEGYARDLYAAVRLVADQRGEGHHEGGTFGLLFRELHLTLMSLSRPDLLRSAARSARPEADAVSLALLLGLEPKKAPGEEVIQAVKQLPLPIRRHVSRRIQEDGLDGVHFTQRLEEIDHALISEFQLGPLLLADRLLNTGFLALERQPRREKRRDVLLAALMPWVPEMAVVGAFAKVCWFQAILRLSLILREHQLHNTEFRWIEGDPLGRVRTASFLLQDMPRAGERSEVQVTPAYRREFMTALHWLPRYLDIRESFHAIGKIDGEFSPQAGDADAMLRWGAAAWRAQREDVGQGSPLNPKRSGGKLQVRDFAMVHIMQFLPGIRLSSDQLSGGHLLGRLSAGLNLGDEPDRHASITWIPPAVQEAASWRFAAHGLIDNRIFPADEDPDGSRRDKGPGSQDAGEIAGRLITAWLLQWLKEIWRV